MLTKEQLREIHHEKVPLHILELDYIQSIILKHIYLREDTLVFKGGTCLRKVHKLNRFSEDLDFNILKGKPKEMLEHGVKGLERTGIDAEISHFDDRKDVCLAKIRYSGPLYQGKPLSMGSIQIDISKHKVHKTSAWSTVMENYADVGTYSLKVMDPQEILAEKFRALVQREMPRDLYDIWFLLNIGISLDTELLEQKFTDLGMEPEEPKNILEDYSTSGWERDMENLIHRVPKKETILGDIKKRIGL